MKLAQERRDETKRNMRDIIFMIFLLMLFLSACSRKEMDTAEISDEMDLIENDTIPSIKRSDSSNYQNYTCLAFIDLRIIDKDGNDLLDPSSTSPNKVDLSKIDIYHVREGAELRYYNPWTDAPWGFSISPPESTFLPYYLMTIYFDVRPDKGTITTTMTLVDWGDGRRDLFKVEFYHSPTMDIQQKVWLNDTLIWDRATSSTEPKYVMIR